MEDWLIHPVVQGAVTPFVAGLLVSALLAPLRLAGLSLVAGFAAAIYLVVGFQFSPLTTIRKVMLLGLLAPLIGVAVDFAFRPRRPAVIAFAIASGVASVWVFETVLGQMALREGALAGGLMAAYVAWQVGIILTLRDEPIRAGAAGLALGLGTGAAAVFAASATLGLYAMALGSASGAFLLVQVVTGRRTHAGMAFTLTLGVAASLVGGAAFHLAQLPWYALAPLMGVPVAARVPLPAKWPIWAQAMASGASALAVAGVACYLTWQAGRVATG